MSPVSRGRKGKKTSKNQARTADRAGAGTGEPEFEAADLALEDTELSIDRGGFEQLIDEIAATIGRFEDVDDPVDGEYMAASLLAATYGTPEYDEPFAMMFVDEAEKLGGPGALAFLRCVAALTADPARAAALEAAARLAAAGASAPDWVAELDEPVTAGEYLRWPTDDGQGAVLYGSFERAGRSDGVLLFVDDEDCGAANDLAPFIGEGLTEARRLTNERESAPEEPITAGEFRWQVESALNARALHERTALELGIEPPEPEDPDEVSHEVTDVVLRARIRALPMPDKPLPAHTHPELSE
ncbi:hypothetical protein BJY24_001689 [Nocardia transvalensis]|uniref:Uncharacterized protein n=1 Tax=Nocardia transvalensis TaxID=37333 RepID=A0A7W9PB56_9NOCA|nr:hypothetical protein [Nocardia transvalensis]MBB5912822.1 hypothetical protein [Nocardia transvalensis]